MNFRNKMSNLATQRPRCDFKSDISLTRLAALHSQAFSLGMTTEKQICVLSGVTNTHEDCWKLLSETTKEDEKEIEEVAASRAAAKEISTRAEQKKVFSQWTTCIFALLLTVFGRSLVKHSGGWQLATKCV